MLLQDLPEPVKKLALENGGGETSRLEEAFTWGGTPQGHDFWSDIYHGRYDRFLQMFPEHNYKPGDLVVVTQGFSRCRTWMRPEEIVELGGRFWHSKSGINLFSGIEIKARTLESPDGNGNSWVLGAEKIIVRRATETEKLAFKGLGLGVTVHHAAQWAKTQRISKLPDFLRFKSDAPITPGGAAISGLNCAKSDLQVIQAKPIHL